MGNQIKYTSYYPGESSGLGGGWGSAFVNPFGSQRIFSGSAAVSVNPGQRAVPIGSIILVNGRYYYVHDTGPGVGSGQIDLISQYGAEHNITTHGDVHVVGHGPADWQRLTASEPPNSTPPSDTPPGLGLFPEVNPFSSFTPSGSVTLPNLLEPPPSTLSLSDSNNSFSLNELNNISSPLYQSPPSDYQHPNDNWTSLPSMYLESGVPSGDFNSTGVPALLSPDTPGPPNLLTQAFGQNLGDLNEWDYSQTGQTPFGDQSTAGGFDVSQDTMGYNPATENRNTWQDIADGFTNAFQSYPVPGVYADNGSQSTGGNIGDFQPNGDLNQPYQAQSDFNPSLGSDLNSGIYSGPQPASYFNQAQWDAGTGGYDANGQWQTWDQPGSMSTGGTNIPGFGGDLSLGSDLQSYHDYESTPVSNSPDWITNASQAPWQTNATSSQPWQSNAASEPWQYSASHPANDYLPTYADALALGHGAVLPMNPTDALSMDYANLSSLGYSLGPMVSDVGASGWASGHMWNITRPVGLA